MDRRDIEPSFRKDGPYTTPHILIQEVMRHSRRVLEEYGVLDVSGIDTIILRYLVR